jgi:hypothetical protein
MTLARRTIRSTAEPQGCASPEAEEGWDPYEVWYTRVLLPRRRAERAAGRPRPVEAVFPAIEAASEARLIAPPPPARA